MQVTATSVTTPDGAASHLAPNLVNEHVSESDQRTSENVVAAESKMDEDEQEHDKNDQRWFTGNAAHIYHLQQHQRIYAQQFPEKHDICDEADSEEDADERMINGRMNPAYYLGYGEDHQKPFNGSSVAVQPSGYLPQGVWRPEDNTMNDPEQGI